MSVQQRLNAFDYYVRKALSPAGFSKILRDPASISRGVRSLAGNRIYQSASTEELLRIAEDSVHALGRMAKSVDFEWPTDVSPDTAELGELFRKHGSDKSTHHDYYEVYGSLINRHEPLRILEIGLGTNNIDTPSNMGLGGSPGASLRAFRDWAPKAEVYGADIDRRILFEEDRIKTFFVDQTDPASLKALVSQVGSGFDLIIDDGLHEPHANLNTIEALLPLLKPSGAMVIEDIEKSHLPYWHTASRFFDNTKLVSRLGGYLFVLTAASIRA